MQQIKWSADYLLGLDMIDAQHEEIFKLFGRVNEKLETREYTSMVEDIVVFLSDYVDSHFAQEEEFQDFIEYPYLNEHREYHMIFKEEFEQYKHTLKEDGPPMHAIKGLNMLADWLVTHIQNEDYKLVRYIQRNNY